MKRHNQIRTVFHNYLAAQNNLESAIHNGLDCLYNTEISFNLAINIKNSLTNK